ncbi:unnamed protein product [Fraxinus pennsylvanica]|uniref:Uncharacterized protein n=1 Tax=Fraxinus pennsylvanica TaxID=56036 RepID=A0AAD1ZIA6_9LAMI|nr:unnamed protein product [Fraxinus pennsylvanica]
MAILSYSHRHLPAEASTPSPYPLTVIGIHSTCLDIGANSRFMSTTSQWVHFDKGTPALANEIKKALEGNDVLAKIDAMKNAIMLLLNGGTLSQLFVTRLLDTFYQIRAARVCSRALWIIGEYCLSLLEVESGIATIKQCLGDLPLFRFQKKRRSLALQRNPTRQTPLLFHLKGQLSLLIGTYATQSAASETTFSP